MGENENKKAQLDSVFAERGSNAFFDWEKTEEVPEKDSKSVLFSRGKRMESFFTEDSKLYITPKEQKLIERGIKLNSSRIFDGASVRIVGEYRKIRTSKNDFLYKKLIGKLEKLPEEISEFPENFARQLTPMKLWNLSVVGAIILGMVSMTFIYKYLGSGASAVGNANEVASNTQMEKVLGEEDTKVGEDIARYIEQVVADSEKIKEDEFEKRVTDMVKGYPIKEMLPFLFEKDRTVIAFYIAIAKKESNWGKRVPVLKGEDCYNYVGYRAIREKMGSGGHTCFNSPKDAVDTITKRMAFLIEEKKLDTPAKMSIWKCGSASACKKDKQVGKWISDVESIHNKLKK